jgi:FAD/FMN-containing dehydrogenase
VLHTNRRRQAKTQRLAEEWNRVDETAFRALGVTREELRELEFQLLGRIVLPGMPDYDESRLAGGLCPFVGAPLIIVYCLVPSDVQLCLTWSHAHDWWVTCRSGGHSTAGYSVNTGMVLDVSGISYVSVDPRTNLARVGAGTQFHELNSVLNTYRLHVPGGTCPDVGVAGYMQGGGYGLTSLLFGMNCDHVTEAKLMLADGRMVIADSTTNADLFWAIRGGTGNNFGVLLEVTYRVEELDRMWGFCLQWPLEEAPAVLAALQSDYMKAATPPNLGYEAALISIDGRAVLAMIGMYTGRRAEGFEALAQVRQIGSPALRADQYGTYAELNDSLFAILPELPLGQIKEVKRGGYIASALTASDWAQVTRYFATAPHANNMIDIGPYGGAIGRESQTASAFVHRTHYMDFFVDSFYEGDAGADGASGAKEWLDGFTALMQPFFNGHMYQNYPVPDFPDYRWAYWGDAFNSLLFVKQKYDPENFFHFEQGITPYPEAEQAELRRSTAPSMFSEPGIAYEDSQNR